MAYDHNLYHNYFSMCTDRQKLLQRATGKFWAKIGRINACYVIRLIY